MVKVFPNYKLKYYQSQLLGSPIHQQTVNANLVATNRKHFGRGKL